MRRVSVSCTGYDLWAPKEDHLLHRVRDLSRRGSRLNVSWPVLKRRGRPRGRPDDVCLHCLPGIIAGWSSIQFFSKGIRRNEQPRVFINAVTPELKTPFAPIRMYLQTLRSRTDLQRWLAARTQRLGRRSSPGSPPEGRWTWCAGVGTDSCGGWDESKTCAMRC